MPPVSRHEHDDVLKAGANRDTGDAMDGPWSNVVGRLTVVGFESTPFVALLGEG